MSDSALRVHIGHHFFGTGNIGDDLMMAGFLLALRRWRGRFTLTCCILGDTQAQQRRFPEVRWLTADHTAARECIERCDIWLGLGDTPFQSVVGTWLIDFLQMQALHCERLRKPMYFLGVGVHDAEALRHPAVTRLVAQAQATWTRDALSYELLLPLARDRVHGGADLAALYLASAPAVRAAGAPSLGLTLNFEGAPRYDSAVLEAVCRQWSSPAQRYWLVQEVRSLPGSERAAYADLAPALQACFVPVCPDYGAPSVDALLEAWPAVSHAVTSRYHAALIHAWRGARVAVVERELKLRSLTVDLGLCVYPDVASAVEALPRTEPVAAARLADVHARAARSVAAVIDSWLELA
jgi:polysaccharide pyruvyl transferase WcaK-like protein